MPDLRVVHDEHIAEDGVQHAAVPSGGPHRAFSDDDVVLFDHATDMYCGAANERVVFNLFVEGALSFDMKCAGYQPFDVVGQARQNFRVIGSREGIHVLLNGLFIWGHVDRCYSRRTKVVIGPASESQISQNPSILAGTHVARFAGLSQPSSRLICSAAALSVVVGALISGCGSEAAVTPIAPASVASTSPHRRRHHHHTTPSPTPAPPPQSPAPPAKSTVKLSDDFGGRALFPSSNWWNQDISRAPVDAQSNTFIDFIGRDRGLHPDFGPPPYGIPYMGVGSTEPRVPVTFVAYGSESDDGFRGERGYPIPEAAKSQPNYIEGGEPGGGTDGDRHMLIVDRDRWVLYELFAAQWNTRAIDGKPGRAPCSISRRTAGVRKDGRQPMPQASRSCPGWFVTTRRGAAASITPCASPCAPRTVTCGPRRTRPAADPARCRWARGFD